MRCAGEVDLTTTALLSLPHEPLPYPGQHETCRCTRWNGSTLILVFAGCCRMVFLERCRRGDCQHLDSVPPGGTRAGLAATNSRLATMPNTSALSH